MSKYKVGDIAALFPQPKTPTTETGKKLQSLFNNFHQPSKNKFSEKETSSQLPDGTKKSKKLFGSGAKTQREDRKSKKRRFSALDVSPTIANTKTKKLKTVISNEDKIQIPTKITAYEIETKYVGIKNALPEGKIFPTTKKAKKKKIEDSFSNQQISKSKLSKSSVSEFKLNKSTNVLPKSSHFNFIKKKKISSPSNDSENLKNENFAKQRGNENKLSGLVSTPLFSNNKVKKVKEKKLDGDDFQTYITKVDDETKPKRIKGSSAEEKYFPRTKKALEKYLEINNINQKRHKFSEKEMSDLSMPEFKFNENNYNETRTSHINFVKTRMVGRQDNDFNSHDNPEHEKIASKKEKKAFKQKNFKLIGNEDGSFNEKINLKAKHPPKSKKQVKSKNKIAKLFEVESNTTSNLKETDSNITSTENKKLKRENNSHNDNKLHLKNLADDTDGSKINSVHKIFELKRKRNAKKYKDSKSLSLNGRNNFIKVPGVKCDISLPINRTLFVGNLPLTVSQKALGRLFSTFGIVENVRIRGVIPKKETIPKKIAAIKREYHNAMRSLKGFVTFREESCVSDALQLNGSLFQGHHIVVDQAYHPGQRKKYDDKRSIFIGNLPFDVEDEAIWSAFSQCGLLENVRIIRDRDTGIGKGFGYVVFKDEGSKKKALSLEDIEINGRKIRIKDIESKQNETEKTNSSKQYQGLKAQAVKIKKKKAESNSRKSIKKLIKKQKMIQQKKHIASFLQNKKSE